MSIFYSTTELPSSSKTMAELVSMMRMYLRDYPHLNRLIDGEETSDRMIAWAILDAIQDFNTNVKGQSSLHCFRKSVYFANTKPSKLLRWRYFLFYIG